MADFSVDSRIKFNESVLLNGQSGSLTWEIYGGPLAMVLAGVFDENDQPLQGIGFGNFGQPLTTEKGGRTSWLFAVPPNASYLKWGVQAFRSGGNLGSYSVTAKVNDAFGKVLAVSQFSATIPDKSWKDEIIPDGVNLSHSEVLAIQGGKFV